ncbi:MAG: hypothetical protein ACYDBJ_25745 [Aggregatilineales bacterium]
MTTQSTDTPIAPDLVYHTVAELRALPPDALAALWESVPTERQGAYRATYDSQLRAAGAQHSDKQEWQVLEDLITRYEGQATVPMSDGYWTNVPPSVRQAVQSNLPLAGHDDRPQKRTGANQTKSPLVLIGGAAIVAVLMLTRLPRMFASHAGPPLTTPVASPTVVTHGTPPATLTPTPLALDNQDAVIRGGDQNAAPDLSNPNNTAYNKIAVYPVSLRVFANDTTNPRVFVVQARRINTTEWNYDPDPDTASDLAGLLIRPVIGIPWSEANAALFDTLDSGATFELQMNTGAVLRFTFATKQPVTRADTQALRQTTPGLVLLLIGERDTSGQPTATRMQVEASYWDAQEMAGDGLLTFQSLVAPTTIPPTPTLTATPDERLDVELIGVTSSGSTLSTNGSGYVTARIHIVNRTLSAFTVGPDTIWMAFGYDPDPLQPRIPSEGLTPFQLQPDQAVDLTIYYPWNGETYASLGIGEDYRFSIRIK